MKKLLLVDGNNLVFRAFYATSSNKNMTMLRANDGTATNALLIFITMLEKVLRNEYDYVLVAFDKGSKNFRYNLLKTYKEKRLKTPQELILQLELVKTFLDSYGINWFEHPDFEADDIIATLTVKAQALNWRVEILSSDGDLEQLLSDNATIIKPRQGLSNIEIVTVETIATRWQLLPSQICDLKGLKGDVSDNLPGIKGIGEKTALMLLHKYHNLENILQHQDELRPTIKAKIAANFEMGLLCKKMAMLRFDVPFNLDLTALTINFDALKLRRFYLKYNLKSLLNRLDAASGVENMKACKIITVWKSEYESLQNALDVAMSNSNYHATEITGFGIANEKGIFFLSYTNAIKDVLFLEFLKNKKVLKYCFNAKKVINGCYWNQIEISGLNFDVQLAGYVLNATIQATLDNFINYFTRKNFISDAEFYGRSQRDTKRSLKEIADFIGNKAYWILNLTKLMTKKLVAESQWDLYQTIEFPCNIALAAMERAGINVDQKELASLSTKVLALLTTLNNEINLITNSNINLNSPKQLKTLLYEVLNLPNLKKDSTAQDVLLALQEINPHPVIQKILEYRKYQKTYSTYLKGLEKYLLADGKIHTIYNQTVTVTGRLSSQEPNMQNISIHNEQQKLVRKVLIPSFSNEQVVLASDYSQIELKILAHMADVKELIWAFNNNIDIHALTASKLFLIPESEINNQQRRVAKAVNFGIIYGISDFGLSKQLRISIVQAKKFIEKYFLAFPEIKQYHQATIKFCQENLYVKTLFNRIRFVPTINDRNKNIREEAERQAINMPIQGTAADIIKLALVAVETGLRENNCRSYLTGQVHDELILDVFQDELEKVIAVVKTKMTEVVKLKVPLNVDITTGDNWYEV